jgi:crotonobetainyl-CoA:carnitine CoA-transferase CaiB-like acyl-CoA transferase
VLDLTLFLSGPFGTQILGDLGAEIIKVEPKGGDMTRQLPPNFVAGDSAYYHSINRNKKSMVIDYKRPEGLDLLKQLVANCDVLIENQKPGALAEHGISYATMSGVNPRLIYCSISGFGQHGPDRDRPAYDMVVQALSGGMSLTGEPGGKPVRAGIPVGDLAGGMYAAIGILAALEARHLTGKGQYIDIGMLDCQIAMLTYQAAYYLQSGTVPGPQGRGHESIPTYRSFTARDGRDVVVCANTDRMWHSLCGAAGLHQLRDDPQLQSRQGRYRHGDMIIAAFDRVFAERDAAEWVALLREAGIPVATVNTLDQALNSEQVRQRNMILALTNADGEQLRVAGNPIKTSGLQEQHAFPPKLAANTADILRSVLQLGDAEIAALQADGIVESHAPHRGSPSPGNGAAEPVPR